MDERNILIDKVSKQSEETRDISLELLDLVRRRRKREEIAKEIASDVKKPKEEYMTKYDQIQESYLQYKHKITFDPNPPDGTTFFSLVPF